MEKENQAEEAREGEVLTAKPSKEGDDAFLARVREWFRVTSDFEAEEREAMLDDLRFVRLGGDYQWPDYAKASRQTPGAERPMLTDNRVKQYRTSVINQIRQNTPAIDVRPVDDKADKKTADILQGVIRNIEALSKADNVKDKAVEYAVDCGRGFIGLMTQYTTDDSWEQDIAYRLIPDPFKVYFDPYSVEPDGSDAKVAMLVEDIPRRQFEEEYPDVSLADWDAGAAGDVDGWMAENTIRVAEHYEVVETPMELLLLEDGRTIWADEMGDDLTPVVQKRNTVRKRCVWTKIGGNKVLDRRELPTQYVPIIPVYGEEFWSEGQHYMQGLVRAAKDPQRMYNFWLSSVAEQVALQPKVPFIAPEGSFEGHEPEWSAANSKNFSYLEYTPVMVGGQILAGPSRQPPPPIPTGYVEQMNSALDGIKAAVGMQNPAIGKEESANQSGKAIRSLQMQASIGTSHFGDNLAKAVEHSGRIIIEMIPHIYDTPRILRILGEDGAPDYAQHDPNAQSAVQQQQNPLTGEIKTIYNLGVGRYDVRVQAGPSYGTKRQEGFDSLMQLAQADPQVMQLCGDLILRLSDSPYADEMADRIKAMLPPQVLQATENPDADPQLQAANSQIQQMGQQMQQMQQAMQQMQAELQSKQEDIQLKAQENQIKAQDINLKMYEAQTKRAEITGQLDTEEAIRARKETEIDREMMERRLELAEVAAMQGMSELMGQFANQSQGQIELLAQMTNSLAQLNQRIEGNKTVGIRAMRSPDGRVVGGVQIKADGTEVPVRLN